MINEPCHYHKSGWRMLHHVSFCRFMGCKNFKRMLEKYNEDKKC